MLRDHPRVSVLLASLLLAGLPVLAADGVIEINQAKALSGGVTPGDAAGFPVTIDVSGSYALTGDLAGSGKLIDITTGNVTLDLNGFTITNSGSSDTVEAQHARAVRITNGTIEGGLHGVSFQTDIGPLTVATHQLDHVSLLDQTGSAVEVIGNNVDQTHAVITDNTILSPGDGISLLEVQGGRIARNVIKGGGGSGIFIHNCSAIEIGHNRATGNSNGIWLVDSSALYAHHNTLTENGNGILLGGGGPAVTDSVLDWNHSGSNSSWGILISPGSTGNFYSFNRTLGNSSGGIDDPGGNTDGGDNF